MIETKRLTVRYNGGRENECVALRDVDLTVEDGEMVAVTGKSGAGKSTLLSAMSGLIGNYEGECRVDGVEIGSLSERERCLFRRKRIGLVFQDDLLIDECSVRDNLLLALDGKRLSRAEREKAVAEALRKVNFVKKHNCVAGELSGGERKRVAIARALMNEHALILADEPTGNLDSANGKIIVDLLREINGRGTTVIIVTHDRDVAEACDRTIVLSDGMIVRD